MNQPPIYRQPSHDRPNVFSRYWSPQTPGETSAGWLAGISTESSQYGPQEMLGWFDESGRERVVRLSVGLDDQIRALRLLRGHGFAIQFRGENLNGQRGRQFSLTRVPSLDNVSILGATSSEASLAPGLPQDPTPF